MIVKACYESPIGFIKIEATDKEIVAISFIDPEQTSKNQVEDEDHPILQKAIVQLDEYFQGDRKRFTLPLNVQGTEFQKAVWRQVETIPYGETRTYLDIARKVGNEKAVRAVGNANRNNKLLLVIPCHRVVGSNQKLTGYAGGLWRKEWLLNHEK